MKKFLLFFALIMSILFTANAGYVIRGINTTGYPQNLLNYTVALNKEGKPVSAASMYTTFFGGGTGRNTIVIVSTDPLPTFFFTSFPISLGLNEDFNINVRDFHYITSTNTYVLCGSRETATYSHAFVAVIDGNLTTMEYNEYPEAEIFYSIWGEYLVTTPAALGYFVCGKRGDRGVIASINRSNLNIMNLLTTREEQRWEYHKIIAKYGMTHEPHFVVSGRNPECTQVGFTVLDPYSFTTDNYAWEQNSEPASLSVVCDYYTEYNRIVLSSSYQGSLTMNPVTFPVSSFVISAYRFYFSVTPYTAYNIQDIGMFEINDVVNPRISVVGYIEERLALRRIAWHGYVGGLSSTSILRNNFYFGSDSEDFRHYKIKGNQQGNEFTGGFYQNNSQMCALFGTPLTLADDCDHHNTNSLYIINELPWSPFYLEEYIPSERHPDIFGWDYAYLPIYDHCFPFKGEEPAPEFAMSVENENEITTFHDRIIVKDIPVNTHYQIYSVTGQLIQTGTTTPYISTAQLSKGLYILRLENGKAFKFVK